MDYTLQTKDPMVLVKGMDSYFKDIPPDQDCSLFLQDSFGIHIHKELMYQTKFMREMVESVGIDSKIQVICPSLTKEELEIIVHFLYSGKILSKSQAVIFETTKNLEELFGFPSLKCNVSETTEAILLHPKPKMKSKKLSLNSNFIRNDFPEPTIKIENDLEVGLKNEFECDLKEFKVKKELVEDSINDPLWTPHFLDPTEFNCEICDHSYRSRSDLRNHIEEVHEGNSSPILKCSLCGNEDFKNRKTLINHINLCNGIVYMETGQEQGYPCSNCGKVYKTKAILRTHAKNCGKEKKKSSIKCPVCKEVFESRASQIEHVALEHPEKKIYNCQYCDFKCLQLRSTLGSHLSRKHPNHNSNLLKTTSRRINSSRTCPVCKKEFQTRLTMIEHYTTTHPDAKIYNCPFCDAKYLQGPGLEKHISKIHPEHDSNIYCAITNKQTNKKKCSICKIVFKSKVIMIKHFTSMHPEANVYNCSLCDEQYLTLQGLQDHTFNHHERKVTELGCSFCGTEFISKLDLDSHIATEHKEKKYECSKCDASYRSKMSLQVHIEQVHEGKKYQCTTCGEVFESVRRLETHTAMKHDRTKLFECHSCTNTYTTKRGLEEHIGYVHEQATGHLCPECGESFRDKTSLRDHVFVVHEGKKYKCQLCDKSYGIKAVLRNHVRVQHEGKTPQPEKCPHCEKVFKGVSCKGAVKRHIREVHEKKRPWACHLCGLSFSQSGNLKTHIKGKHKDAI